ncbi:Endonuclease, Uma2 family (restriction endonuclease fold) [Allochromatium warmingii]|uniref:Endonuclease, Uma2 family (Restriction endonuclease fold) n=1 Tax=Allochromatium warmingii TaxID=61595 RepID=A0A1H3HH02_ALLWA|nr:Uma2 family endonuclease [Allochromatium warmingii]SDY14742.1 Endonuclease, Uma2 family (restriction endonuclease fold) [Allochromatium warmingii]
MSALNLSPTIISVDDYLAGEHTAELRYEYINGQVYAMTGASRQHGIIVSNLVAALRPLVRGRGCQLFASDMKVRLQIADQDIFYYPDLLLSCAADDREPYYCTQPCVIVEVLSPSTERLDRREKFLSYITLPSLQDYLLVSQTERAIWHHRRSCNWHVERVTEGSLTLDCLGIGLPLSLIYEELDT